MSLSKGFCCWFAVLTAFCSTALALDVSPAKDPELILQQWYPEGEWTAAKVENHRGETLPYRQVRIDGELAAYVFETQQIQPVPAYSGQPVNILVALSPEGDYLHAQTLEHHEPILLVGIKESKLDDFTRQYPGLNLDQRMKVGGNAGQGQVQLDGISGATVTVMVMNVSITRAATDLARALGMIEADTQLTLPAKIRDDLTETKSWQALTGDGSIRRLRLSHDDIDQAFAGTAAEGIDEAPEDQKQAMFADIFYTLADLPVVGRSLLGDSEYQWLQDTLQPGEHALLVLGNGYSYKGSGYVRGGIFDRIQLLQDDQAISFRDLDYQRVQDIYLPDAPSFSEKSLFIIREHHEFDPGAPWQFELLVRRQIGAIDSVFTSFQGNYTVPEAYVDRPAPVEAAPELELWQEVWLDRQVEVIILLTGLAVLLVILFFQDVLVRYPKLVHNVRNGYLIFTVVFIGWYTAGQISVVNVFTFLQALMSDFSWETFLLDPIIFIMWVAVAVTALLWGRGVFCGWLCPFGALQELINHVARWFKVPQFELPWAVHERLWAVKYLILLALFGLSLQSLAMAEQYAEIEPFKTTFLLKFSREWGYVLWAALLLLSNLFTRKLFCRYLCPLGAALSVPVKVKLFDWLKRRDECGKPCRVCANECEIQAIEPDGTINQRECHYCLDCQMTYFNEEKCPPLIKKAKQARKRAIAKGEQIELVTLDAASGVSQTMTSHKEIQQ